MPDSPLSASPYQVLGVDPGASEEELKRAFRRRLRETHPDAGGSAAEFTAVQHAWTLVGTPEARSAFDAARGAGSPTRTQWAPRPAEPRRSTRPTARSSGHPGGWYRERYLHELRAWVGLGDPIDDPYDPALVRSAPWPVRHLLAAAVAEEESARRLSELGIGFTIWHDVATDAGKIDHVVLGPTGLWAVQSEDWGSEVDLRRGELVGEGIPAAERPLHDLAARARLLGRAARAKFSAVLVVVPDEAFDGVVEVGRIRGAEALVSERSRLVSVLRDGVEGVGVGGTDLFELRSRIAGAVRFV